MFAAEFEPAELANRRRAPRASVALDTDMARGGLDRALCRVTDISVQGARLQTYTELKRGLKIWLRLPKVGKWRHASCGRRTLPPDAISTHR